MNGDKVSTELTVILGWGGGEREKTKAPIGASYLSIEWLEGPVPVSAVAAGAAEDLLPPKKSLKRLAIVAGVLAVECGCEMVEARKGKFLRGQRGVLCW